MAVRTAGPNRAGPGIATGDEAAYTYRQGTMRAMREGAVALLLIPLRSGGRAMSSSKARERNSSPWGRSGSKAPHKVSCGASLRGVRDAREEEAIERDAVILSGAMMYINANPTITNTARRTSNNDEGGSSNLDVSVPVGPLATTRTSVET